jgi:hypothetical protein
VSATLVEKEGVMPVWGDDRLGGALKRVDTFLDRYLRP